MTTVQYLNTVTKGKLVDPKIPAPIVQKYHEITKLQTANPEEKDTKALYYLLYFYCPTTRALETTCTLVLYFELFQIVLE